MIESLPRGLSNDAARQALQRFGPNELAALPTLSTAKHLARALATPLMLILLAASAVAASVGEHLDAGIIVTMVLLSAVLDAVQTTRSTRAAERLRQSVVPTACAERDGEWREIPRREVVPGDVIRLAAGDLVPADAQLVESHDLHVQQAALTGESLPAEKHASVRGGAAADPQSADRVFLGTSVVSGDATALVTATGKSTAFGDIAARLRERPPETEFERGMRGFGMLLSQTVIFLVLFLVLASIAMRRDPLESLLFAVALAVGLVPEFMPMITSITLANGAVRMARDRVVVKHLSAIQNFGSIDVLCSDKTGTLTQGAMRYEGGFDSQGAASAQPLALAAVTAALHTGVRNPLDDAIVAAAPPTPEWRKIDEAPFDFERRRMSVVAERAGQRRLIAKGAPEAVLAVCPALDDLARRRVLDLVHARGAAGFRLLAVASRAVEMKAAYNRSDEHDLTYEGLLCFADPPLPDAADAITALGRDGVQVKIITGDDEAVARHVCAATGVEAAHVVVGAEIDDISDAAFGAVAERTQLFARVSPRQKLRIVLALKARGHVVGYLGDGINDAPALHAADVGISVASAVDVAKDAADIILLERGLHALHGGIVEGRKAFGNVMKYLLMGTSSNFGNMFSMAGASLLIPFLPMLPTQILVNNFLYDVAQLGLPTDRVDESYVQKPHRWDIRALRRFMIRIGLVSSLFDFATFGVLLFMFRATPAAFRTGWFVESLITQILVVFVIRTMRNPLRSRPSRALALSAASTVVVGIALPYSPLAGPLGFTPPPAGFLAFVALATALYLVLVDVVKRRVASRLIG